MRMNIAVYFGLLCYLALVAGVSLRFDLDLWAFSLLYLGVPVLWFITHEQVAPKLIGVIGIFAVVSAFLWESVGYTHGLWYELTVFDWRVLDTFPVEIIVWNALFLYFMVFMYEYFQDDRVATVQSSRKSLLVLTIFLLLMIGVSTYVLLLGTFLVEYSYSVLLGLSVITAGAACLIAHRYPGQLLRKALIFTILFAPVLFLHEYVSLVNVHWIFANPAQYITTVPLFGHLVPLEEIIFIAVIPVWTILIYELFLDDAA